MRKCYFFGAVKYFFNTSLLWHWHSRSIISYSLDNNNKFININTIEKSFTESFKKHPTSQVSKQPTKPKSKKSQTDRINRLILHDIWRLKYNIDGAECRPLSRPGKSQLTVSGGTYGQFPPIPAIAVNTWAWTPPHCPRTHAGPGRTPIQVSIRHRAGRRRIESCVGETRGRSW